MKTDTQLQNEIINELNRESAMVAAECSVRVNRGEVVLEGIADSYAKKMETERAALRISDVKKVVNNVILKISSHRSDDDIKKTVLKVITWNSCINESKINVEVKGGCVTLTGEVEWEYQKTKAAILTSDISGVVDVKNELHVNSDYRSSETKLSA